MYLLFFLLLLAFPEATQQAQIHPEISIRSRVSKILRWNLFGCICNSDAIIYPTAETEFEATTTPNDPTVDSEDVPETSSISILKHCIRKSRDFSNMMAIDPLDTEAINEQYFICERRNSKCDRLSNLCRDIVLVIKEYLSPESVFELRQVNRRFFLSHLVSTRHVLYKTLSPRITTGFECLFDNSNSAVCLNPYLPEIASLLSESSRPKPNLMLISRAGSPNYGIPNPEVILNQTNDLKALIILALHFYRRKNINLFWKLLEAVVKGQLNFGSNDFIFCFGFGLDEMLIHVCRNNFNSLGKRLIGDHVRLFDIDLLYSGCASCLIGSNFVMFKRLIKEITKHNLNWVKLSNLFRETISSKSHRFAELLLETFSFKNISSPNSLCLAISVRDYRMTELLLKYRKSMDFKSASQQGCNYMEMAARINFVDGIVLLQSVASSVNFNFFKNSRPLCYAIEFGAYSALSKILQIVTENSKKCLDQIYSFEEITLLLCTAIREKGLASLKLVLQNIKSHDIGNFKRYFRDSDDSNSELYIYSILHFCITSHYEEGFDVLVAHFGKRSLEVTDRLGRNPFLLAVTLGHVNFVSKIAQLHPESIHSVDINRNNALHITLSLYHSKTFLKRIVGLGIDINAKNNFDISPLEAILAMNLRNYIDVDYELYEILLSQVRNYN